MSTIEIISKIEELKSLEALINEAEQEAAIDPEHDTIFPVSIGRAAINQ